MSDYSNEKGIYSFKIIRMILIQTIYLIQLKLLKYYHGNQFVNLIKNIKKENGITGRPYEYYHIYSFAKSLSKSKDGDIAEVGVYNGSSAKIICEVKGVKTLYLFDTFAGLINVSDFEDQMEEGWYSAKLDKVKDYLDKYENVEFYKGNFPNQTGHFIEDKKFCFVHLDVDTYKCTMDSLKFFYPKMVKGGIILSHDVNRLKGVKKAFKQFSRLENIEFIKLNESQAFFIKE